MKHLISKSIVSVFTIVILFFISFFICSCAESHKSDFEITSEYIVISQYNDTMHVVKIDTMHVHNESIWYYALLNDSSTLFINSQLGTDPNPYPRYNITYNYPGLQIKVLNFHYRQLNNKK